MENKNNLEQQIIETLKTIFDPEIPVNIYDLGLIYKIDINEKSDVVIDMTLTAPNCPMADDLLSEVYFRLNSLETINSVKVNLVFEPIWDKSKLSDEAKLDLGLF
ncbi:MAG: iron-sulfur cluster assembly protein [Bacteroidales bacterium]|jgi:FeS assembly SUF system protein|nr:iron-sulfur cluster assembly protein [Bacteroidales bacterium]